MRWEPAAVDGRPAEEGYRGMDVWAKPGGDGEL